MIYLEGLAWKASRVAQARTWLSAQDRYEVAYGAMAEHVCLVADATETELLKVGLRAISDESDEIRRSHGGGPRDDSRREHNRGAAFTAFWRVVGMRPPFDEVVTERVALYQVLDRMSELQREALIAMAEFDDYTLAALAVGVPRHTFKDRVRSARNRFADLWYDFEQPPRSKPTGETCRRGHDRAAYGYLKKNGHYQCRMCQSDSDRRKRVREGKRPGWRRGVADNREAS